MHRAGLILLLASSPILAQIPASEAASTRAVSSRRVPVPGEGALLTYSTYLRTSFEPQAIAVDSSGNIYMAGYVFNPSTAQLAAIVVKLNAQANQYLYVRNIGGSVYDWPTAIAVDAAGDAYIAGYTASPDFSTTTDGNLAAAPACSKDSVPSSCARSFAVKLDPSGNTVFSDLLGGATNSTALAVAVDAAGHVFVTGGSSSGFPTTPGAYSVPNTAGGPYLLELDPTGARMVFSATGIGGSSMTLDSSGNIYVAGTTTALNYPTTPGVYQPTLPAFLLCAGPSCFPFQGPNQYVTKIDPTGSKLIFSTALSGSGGTENGGLAVDEAGNVYVTGFAGPSYPFTVTPPSLPSISSVIGTIPGLPFLSKLDPLGQTLLWSVPVGGAGVQVDGRSVYVGGMVGLPASSRCPTASLPC